MKRLFALAFGIGSYGIFFATFLYLIGFLANAGVPKGIDDGSAINPLLALAIDTGLIALFGLQHSVMARPGFKAVWTKIVPRPIERSMYVLLTSLVLIAMYAWWQPLPAVLWQAANPTVAAACTAVFALGLALVLLSSFLINHFDLFGLRQTFLHWRRKPYTELPFQVRFLYRVVRHPLYVGWFLAFWATPVMTVGHLLLAIGMSAYILIAVRYEERDLVKQLGPDYVAYQRRVPRFVPRFKKAHAVIKPATSAAVVRALVFCSFGAMALSTATDAVAQGPQGRYERAATVYVGDLDLGTWDGAQQLYERIDYAARTLCAPQQLIPRLRCIDDTVAAAVERVGAPLLTAIHLQLSEQVARL